MAIRYAITAVAIIFLAVFYGIYASAGFVPGFELGDSKSKNNISPGSSGAHRAGEIWTDPVTGMEFVWVPGGCYMMGTPEGGTFAGVHNKIETEIENQSIFLTMLQYSFGLLPAGCAGSSPQQRVTPQQKFNNYTSDERPVHEVCVDGFWLGRYEVTQGQWERIMGNNPSYYKNGDDYPVEKVSWNDTKLFIGKLNQKTSGQYRFTLPSEAQWEYAARSGGKAEKYSGGNNIARVAWYDKNSGNKTHSVGGKAPNGLGIYDMSGNVWEWCEDIYDKNAYSRHIRKNPVLKSGSSGRVLRGGSWLYEPRFCRAASRSWYFPSYCYSGSGFRLVLLSGQ